MAIEGRTFQEVFEEVQNRARANLPDQVVHVAALKLTPSGEIDHDGRRFRMTEWARKQLGAFLGLSRWGKWFQTTSADERADEITRRLSRIPGKLKIRATRATDGNVDGTIRAVLAERFTPIDDVKILGAMDKLLGRALDSFRFQRVDVTASTTHYSAIQLDARNIEKGDIVPGWHMRNSEVGASAFTIDEYWMTLVCKNGKVLADCTPADG